MKLTIVILCVFLLLFGCLELSVKSKSQSQADSQAGTGKTTVQVNPQVPSEQKFVPSQTPLEDTPFVDEDLPTSKLDDFAVNTTE